MGPACEVLLERDNACTLEIIDGVLASDCRIVCGVEPIGGLRGASRVGRRHRPGGWWYCVASGEMNMPNQTLHRPRPPSVNPRHAVASAAAELRSLCPMKQAHEARNPG
jgi:hypothetical protein